jgi:hypothetical protein
MMCEMKEKKKKQGMNIYSRVLNIKMTYFILIFLKKKYQLYILMMMMDNTTQECVNGCSFSSDILCEMSKKERDGISLLSPPSFSLKKEKRTSSISDLLCFAIVYMASSTFV